MAEAELRIKPRVVDAADSIKPVANAMRRLDREQGRTLSGAKKNVSQLRNLFRSTGDEVRRTGAGLERMQAGLDLLSRATQFVQTGGQKFYEWFLGPNAELEDARTTFRVLVGDAEKAETLIQRVRTQAANTPFQFSELLEGSRRLLRLTGSNIERNESLLKLAETLAAINPSKTVVEASEALLDAQVGEFERLKEFGIKLRKEEISESKKAGKLAGGAFGDDFLDAAAMAISKQTGGRDPVAALAKTTKGRISTLRDIGQQIGQSIGEETWSAVGDGVENLTDKLRALQTDPKFQADIERLGETFADVARWGAEMALKLPSAIEQTRALIDAASEFYEDNEPLIKLLGGGLVANKLTNGAVGRGAMAAGSRALFGSGKAGDAASELLGGTGQGQPVYVTNFDEMGGEGLGDFGARGKSRAAGGLKKGGMFSVGSGGFAGAFNAGGATGIGAGALAAGGLLAGLALVTGTVYTFGKIIEKTNGAVEGFMSSMERQKKSQAFIDKKTMTRKDAQGQGVARDAFRTDNLAAKLQSGDIGGAAAALAKVEQMGPGVMDAANRQLRGRVKLSKGKDGRVQVQGGYAAQEPGLRNEVDRLATYNERFGRMSPSAQADEIASGRYDKKDARASELSAYLEQSEKNAEKLQEALRGARRMQVIQPGAINVNNYVRNAPTGYTETLKELEALE